MSSFRNAMSPTKEATQYLHGWALKYFQDLLDIFDQDFSRLCISNEDTVSIGKSTILICFTNRSGSNYLAELLSSTRKINLAGEFFNPATIKNYCQKHAINSLPQYVFHLSENISSLPWFVSKIGTWQLLVLNYLGFTDSLFKHCHYISMNRSDKLAQAISYSIALQTKAWTSYMTCERAMEDKDIVFDPETIANFIEGLINDRSSLDRYFVIKGISPYIVEYESLSRRPVDTVEQVLGALGFTEVTVNLNAVRTKKQSSYLNEKFRGDFQALFSDKRKLPTSKSLVSLLTDLNP